MVNLFWLPSRVVSIARCLFALRLLSLVLRLKGDPESLRARAAILDFRRSTCVRALWWNHATFASWSRAGRMIMSGLPL